MNGTNVKDIEDLIKIISKLPGLGPNPGNFETILIRSSISLTLLPDILPQKGSLNPGGKSIPPVIFEISSDVFSFNFNLAFVCADTIRSSKISFVSL